MRTFPLVAAFCAFAASSSVEQRYNDILALTSASDNYVVDFNASGYRALVLQPAPSPFQFLVMFTSTVLCPSCDDLEQGFRRVASEYYHADKLRVGSQSSRIYARVFAVIDVREHGSVAAVHAIRSVPHIASITADALQWSRDGEGFVSIPKSSFCVLQKQSKRLVVQSVLDCINSKTGELVEIRPTLSERLTQAAIAIFVTAGAGFVTFRAVKLLRSRPWLLAVFASTVFWLASAGIVYSIQQGAEMFGVNRETGETVLLSPGRRSQYLGEGLTMAAFTVVAAVILFGFALAPRVRYFKEKGGLNYAVAVFGVLLLLLWNVYHSAFVSKLGLDKRYGTFFPPDGFVRGSWRQDRLSSF